MLRFANSLSSSADRDIIKLVSHHILSEAVKNYFMQLQSLLKEQLSSAGNANNRLLALMQQEDHILRDLRNHLLSEAGLRQLLKENVQKVANLEHQEWFMKILKGFSRLRIWSKFRLTVEGQENIPAYGPVVIAVQHFHGDYDAHVIPFLTGRRVFVLGFWLLVTEVNKSAAMKCGPLHAEDFRLILNSPEA